MDEVVAYVVSQVGTSLRYYPHYNHLYSPAALTDHSGSIVERYSYTAFGAQTITAPTGAVRAKSAVGFDRSFTGQIRDIETNLNHMRARMYSPGLGRFISRDALRYDSVSLSGRKPGEYFIKLTDRSGRDTLGLVGQSGYAQRPSYRDGYGLYGAYFAPNHLDPSGRECKQDCDIVVEIWKEGFKHSVISLPWGNDIMDAGFGPDEGGTLPSELVATPGRIDIDSGIYAGDFYNRQAPLKYNTHLLAVTRYGLCKDCDETCEEKRAKVAGLILADQAKKPTYSAMFNNCRDWTSSIVQRAGLCECSYVFYQEPDAWNPGGLGWEVPAP